MKCHRCGKENPAEIHTCSFQALTPGEPVAWQVMVENEAMKEFAIKDIAHDWCIQQKLSGSPYAYWIRPLYTAPQPKRGTGLAAKVLHYYYAALAGDMTRKEMEAAVHKLLGQPQQPLFGDLIAQHPGLSEELAEMQAPNQEPVTWLHPANPLCVTTDPTAYAKGIPLIKAQPQREWVGLTDEDDVVDMARDAFAARYCSLPVPESRIKTFARAIEAKLKEKNT